MTDYKDTVEISAVVRPHLECVKVFSQAKTGGVIGDQQAVAISVLFLSMLTAGIRVENALQSALQLGSMSPEELDDFVNRNSKRFSGT
jgi:hypothetical protein